MERRVWTYIRPMPTYPNLYTLLIGPPGIGKGVAMRPIENMLRAVEEIRVAHTGVSKASLMDDLAEAERRIVRPAAIPPILIYNALIVIAREFGSFLPVYESEFMAALTDTYDNEPYSERKRTRELKFTIEKPCLNILGGTTPSYLQTLYPEGAWDQGFAARMIMIFSAEQIRDELLLRGGHE